MPRLVVVSAPELVQDFIPVLGRALEAHLDTVIAIDDEWKSLMMIDDDYELALKLKIYIIDAASTSCKTGVGIVCPAVVLHRSDIELLWLDDDGNVRFLSMKEMVRRKELIYATTTEPPEDVRLFRLQTYKPHEHRRFFDEQFDILELEVYETLYGSRDLDRWRRITRATVLPRIAEAVAEAAKRYVMEFCVFDEYNVCPGVLLTAHGSRVDVKILKLSAKTENYIAQIDLAGLLASR
jgi:hypothetical protein